MNVSSVFEAPRKLARALRREPDARASHTPADVLPEVRRPGFAFPEDLPKYWWGGDPVRTLLLAGLSATFPPGERFFIQSVRAYQDRIQDPELREAVRRFIGQEAQHSKEHNVLNHFLEARGLGLEAIEKRIQRMLEEMRRAYTPEQQLAHTAAVEHFTALLSEEVLLKYDDVLEEMDPRIAPIWAWHAIEEIEHKAVAFDVYRAIGGSEWGRVREMLIVSVLFPLNTTLHLWTLMEQVGESRNLAAWARSFVYFWVSPGIFRKMIPAYLRYYLPTFHPWKHDTRAMVARAKRRWLRDGEVAAAAE